MFGDACRRRRPRSRRASARSPPTLARSRRARRRACSTSMHTTLAPSRANTSAIVAPMPRAAPVTTATLPSSGLSQSAGGAESAAPTRNTCPSTYADLPDRMNRTVDSSPVAAGLASGDRYTRFTVAPRRISLPSERVNPSSARCAIRSCNAAGFLRRRADDDDPPARAEIAQQRGEELVQRLEPGGLGDAGGVEHQRHRTSRPSGRRGCWRPRRSPRPARRAAVRRTRPLTADQQRARQRRIAGLVAAQRLGLRDAELLGEERSGRRMDDLREQIGSHGT